jgi:3-oxoadipate enol-lactonase
VSERAADGSSSGHLMVPGGTLYWEVEGTGPAVVAIHGGSVDLRMWDGALATLTRSYRVIRYDLRGLGRSAPPASAYRMADDVGAILDHFGESSAAFIGFSTGAAIAVEFAVRYPQRVTALITVGAILPAEPQPPGFDAASQELATSLAAREQARERGDLAAAVAADLDVWAEVHHGHARAQLEQWGMANPYFHTGMGEVEQLGPVTDSDLAAITAPSLIMVGDHDVRLARLWAGHLAKAIPSASLTVIEGADHYVSTAQPHAFGTAVQAFLTEADHLNAEST